MAEDTDPFDDDDISDEGDAAPKEDDNKSFAALRRHAKKLEKENKTYAAKVEELEAFKTGVVEVQKEAAITSVFSEVGLNPKHAELYKAVNKDVEVDSITKDAVAAFAAEYQLITNSGEEVEAPEPQPSGFTPVTTGTGTSATVLDSQAILEKLQKGDFAGLTADVQAGRIRKESIPQRYTP